MITRPAATPLKKTCSYKTRSQGNVAWICQTLMLENRLLSFLSQLVWGFTSYNLYLQHSGRDLCCNNQGDIWACAAILKHAMGNWSSMPSVSSEHVNLHLYDSYNYSPLIHETTLKRLQQCASLKHHLIVALLLGHSAT